MWRHPGVGSRPNVWALGNLGAWALVGEGLITEARAKDWNENNRRLKRSSLFLPHTLSVNEVKVAFRVACMRRGLTYIPGERLVRNGLAHALDIPGRRRPLMTDDTFAIAREGKEPALFFVEADRDTETNIPGDSAHHQEWDASDLWGSDWYGETTSESLLFKFEGYFGYARAQKQVEQFGIKNFRTLTITTGSEKRVLNIAKAAYVGCHGVEVRRYLATNFDALKLADPFDAPWFDAAGSLLTLAL
jgi:Replication-relaxation